MKRRALGGIAAAGLAFAALGGCTAVIDQSSFFPPVAEPPSVSLIAPPGYRMSDLTIDLPNLGAVHVVRLDNPAAETTLIYSGGNGGFVAAQSDEAAALARATGADIILYDYPGRGGTSVPSTIDASIATGPALVAALRARGLLGSGPLFAYGLSFGGSQAAAMVRNGGFAGLVIEGSAADIAAVGRNVVPPPLRPFVRVRVDPELRRFDYLGYASAPRIPVLLIASRDDEIVPPRMMRGFGDQLRARGVPVTIVEVPGAHGTGLDQPAALASLGAFVARNAPPR